MSPTVRFMSSNARPARAPDVVYTDHIESGGPFKQQEKKKIFFFFFHFFFLVVLLVKPHGVRPVLSQPNRHRHPLGWKNIQGVCLVRLSGAVLARLFTVCCNKFSVCIQRDSIDEKEEISRPAPFAKETKKIKKINI